MVDELVVEQAPVANSPGPSLKERMQRFLAKGYLFISAQETATSPEVAETFSYVEFSIKPRTRWGQLRLYLQRLMGTAPQQLPATELYAVFGPENQHIRHSLRSYLGNELVLFTRHVDGRLFIRVGGLVGDHFQGVQTIRYDLENDPLLQ